MSHAIWDLVAQCEVYNFPLLHDHRIRLPLHPLWASRTSEVFVFLLNSGSRTLALRNANHPALERLDLALRMLSMVGLPYGCEGCEDAYLEVL